MRYLRYMSVSVQMISKFFCPSPLISYIERLNKEGDSLGCIMSEQGQGDPQWMERYAEDLLETSGYMITKEESAYVTRNGREVIREFTAEQAPSVEHSVETVQQEQGGMTMQ